MRSEAPDVYRILPSTSGIATPTGRKTAIFCSWARDGWSDDDQNQGRRRAQYDESGRLARATPREQPQDHSTCLSTPYPCTIKNAGLLRSGKTETATTAKVVGQIRGIHDSCKSPTIESFREAFTSWELDSSEAGSLIGVEEATVRELLSAEAINVSEEVVARIVMVALIRTALDLCWSPSVSRQWMKLPNAGDPLTELLRLNT